MHFVTSGMGTTTPKDSKNLPGCRQYEVHHPQRDRNHNREEDERSLWMLFEQRNRDPGKDKVKDHKEDVMVILDQ